jgi:primosomal protein N' (replication factor Y)
LLNNNRETLQVKIALPLPIDQLFIYEVPSHWEEKIKVGQRVIVPFHSRQLKGYVIEKKDTFLREESRIKKKIKKIIKIAEKKPLFSAELLTLARWIASYYLCPLGEVLSIMDPKITKRKTTEIVSLYSQSFSSVVSLTEEQKTALNSIYEAIEKDAFSPFLLYGVTGSGKTEIYVRAIRYLIVRKKKQAIVLVPEIALTPQIIQYFKKYFPGKVALWHSYLSASEKNFVWQKIKTGKIEVVIGPRSAIFSPLPRLGMIVVDEEHETSYKQENTPRYHAREVALKRAEINQCPIILGSATPALESYYQAQQGKFKLLTLKKRVVDRPLPQVEVINMRGKKKEIFSPRLKEKIRERLAKKEQIILLLNRKGYTTFFLCHDCGAVLRCQNCYVALVYHSTEKKCCCHYCNYSQSLPPQCPHCQSEAVGYFGLGTEKVETYLKKNYPEANLCRLEAKTISKKGELEKILTRFKKKEIDILIGTQLVAKGLNFPEVTLVGVISADTALNLPDFRANERTFQLLTQVTGRAGRGGKEGETIIQTFNPEVISITLTGKYEEFYEAEIKSRAELLYPPFQKMIKIELQGEDQTRVRTQAIALNKEFTQLKEKNKDELRLLGPAPAPIFKLRKKFRYQILAFSKKERELREIIKEGLRKFSPSSDLKISVDVDPIGLL